MKRGTYEFSHPTAAERAALDAAQREAEAREQRPCPRCRRQCRPAEYRIARRVGNCSECIGTLWHHPRSWYGEVQP